MKILDKKLYECRCCGTCCKWQGYVRLRENEADKIANFLKISIEEFVEKYTILTDDRKNLSIIEKGNGHCLFLEKDNRCLINSVKPQQCQDFPFTWRFFGWRNSCSMSRNKIK